jgi:hypothetical protein
MAVDSTYLIAGAVGGLAMGSFAGRGPQVAARELGREGTALLVMGICMVVGFMCGGIFAFPVAWFLTAWVRGMGPAGIRSGTYAEGYDGPNTQKIRGAFRQAPSGPTDSPYTVIGPVIVCNKCRHSGPRKPDGNPPAECPACKLPFRSGAKDPVPTGRRSRRAEIAAAREDEDLVELKLVAPGWRR